MHRFLPLYALLVLLLAAGCRVVEEPASVHSLAEPQVLEDGTLVLSREASHYAASLKTNIPYVERDNRALVFHLITPRSGRTALTEAGFPLIIFVQGSAWKKQNLETAIPQLTPLAHHGYVVATVEHRHSGEAIAPAQVQDIKTAIRFFRDHAEQYGIDTTRIGIWGSSSGGHLASMIGLTEGIDPFDTRDFAGHSSAVSAVVNFYGPTDFRRMNDYPSDIDHDAPDSPESLVTGGPIQEPAQTEMVNLYNPITYVDSEKPAPPFLIVHGDKDALVPFNQSALLYTAMQDAGLDVTLYKIEGAGHGPGIWTPRVMDIVITFFDQHLKSTEQR